MKREFEEIRVRIYADTDPGLKHKAEMLAAKMRTSLSDLAVAAIRYTVTKSSKSTRLPRKTKAPGTDSLLGLDRQG